MILPSLSPSQRNPANLLCRQIQSHRPTLRHEHRYRRSGRAHQPRGEGERAFDAAELGGAEKTVGNCDGEGALGCWWGEGEGGEEMTRGMQRILEHQEFLG